MAGIPGGGDAFMKYLDQLEKTCLLICQGIKKAYVQVEFVVDKDGCPLISKCSKE
jgi:hypothetical protein